MEQPNPYQAPQSSPSEGPHAGDIRVRAPRKVAASRGSQWFLDSAKLLKAEPGKWFIIVGLYLFLSMVWGIIGTAVPGFLVVGQIVNILLAPLLIGGIILGMHWVAQKKPLPISAVFAGFVTRPGAIISTNLILILLFLVAAAIASAISGISIETLGSIVAGDPEKMATMLPTVMKFLAAAFLVSIPVMMCGAFAVNQVVLGQVSPLDAIKQSFRGCISNLPVLFLTAVLFILLGFAFMLVMVIVLGVASIILGALFGAQSQAATAAGMLILLLMYIPLVTFLFGVNYAAFRDIFMHAPLENSD